MCFEFLLFIILKMISFNDKSILSPIYKLCVSASNKKGKPQPSLSSFEIFRSAQTKYICHVFMNEYLQNHPLNDSFLFYWPLFSGKNHPHKLCLPCRAEENVVFWQNLPQICYNIRFLDYLLQLRKNLYRMTRL